MWEASPPSPWRRVFSTSHLQFTTESVINIRGFSALLTSDVIDFAMSPAQRLLAGKSFIARGHGDATSNLTNENGSYSSSEKKIPAT